MLILVIMWVHIGYQTTDNNANWDYSQHPRLSEREREIGKDRDGHSFVLIKEIQFIELEEEVVSIYYTMDVHLFICQVRSVCSALLWTGFQQRQISHGSQTRSNNSFYLLLFGFTFTFTCLSLCLCLCVCGQVAGPLSILPCLCCSVVSQFE